MDNNSRNISSMLGSCWLCDVDDLPSDHNPAECLRRYEESGSPVVGTGGKEGAETFEQPIAEKTENVIIEEDVAGTENLASAFNIKRPDNLIKACSSEPVFEFDRIMNRWMRIQTLDITRKSEGENFVVVELPGALIRTDVNSINLLPFKHFMYGNFELEIMCKINANKFHAGKILVSTVYSPEHMWDGKSDYYSVQSGLLRDHVIIDLCGSSESIIPIKWRYHKTFVKLSDTGTDDQYGSEGAVYCALRVQSLLPLNVAAGSSTENVSMSMFYRFTSNTFAGMSYGKVPTASNQMLGMAASGVKSFREQVEKVENVLDYSSKVFNLDKPLDILNSTSIAPRPRLNFSHGKGMCDATPLRLNPAATTTYYKDHLSMLQYASLKSIMRIWGYVESVSWKVEDTVGKLLWCSPIVPNRLSTFDQDAVVYSPLEYISNSYMYWRGTLEFRFLFASTEFHTGSVMVNINFGRRGECEGVLNLDAMSNTYSKTFDLGTEREFVVTVPYIYDTVWRKMATIPIDGMEDYGTNRTNFRTGTISTPLATIKLIVLNKLRPVDSVASTVDCLVMVRAGPSYTVSGLVSNNLDYVMRSSTADYFHDFPKYFDESVPTLKRVGYVQSFTTDVSPKGNRLAFLANKIFNERYKPELYKGIRTMTDLYNKVDEDTSTVYDGMTYNINTVSAPLKTINLSKMIKFQGPDFASGQSFKNIQTKEKFMDIKDILRRPLLIAQNCWVKASTPNENGSVEHFFIPLSPPSLSMVSGNPIDVIARGVVKSPHVAILNMFRYWRGEMRYTIVVKDCEPNTTIYITTIPRSGVTLWGNTSYVLGIDSGSGHPYANFNIAQCGLPVEILIPSINPTCQVEVPFITDVNWALLNQGPSPDGQMTNYNWEEHTEDMVGHLIISSSKNCVVDIFWSAGDSFHVTGLIGLPKSWQHTGYNTQVDNRPWKKGDTTKVHGMVVPQMETRRRRHDQEFNNVDINAQMGLVEKKKRPYVVHKQKVRFQMDKIEKCKPIIKSFGPSLLVGASTYFGGPTAGMATAAALYSQKLETTIQGVTRVSGTVEKTIDQLSSPMLTASARLPVLMEKSEEGIGAITRLVESLIPKNVGSDIYDKVVLIVLEFWNAWQSPNVKQIVASIIKTLILLKLITVNIISLFVVPFKVLVQSMLPSAQINEGEADNKDSILANLCGAVVGIASVMLNWKGCTVSFGASCLDLFRLGTSSATWSTVTNATRFFKDTLDLFRRAFLWVIGQKDPKANALAVLSSKSDFLNKFITEAQGFLAEANNSALRRLPEMKLKFWILVCNAYQIQYTMINMPEKRVSPMLISLCKDVIKKSQELNVALSNAPIRYEPFVICLSGPSQVGKSHMTNTIVRRMLQKIGFSDIVSELVYVKSPGPEYWNGYKDQPVVVFDDYMNMRSPQCQDSQIQDLYNLKSTAVFNPNMARIEEKEIRANPLIVVLCMNEPFPNVDSVIDKEAFYRRRDMIVHVERKPDFSSPDQNGVLPNIRDLPDEIKHNYGHLQFGFYPNSRENKCLDKRLEFDETVEWMSSEFERYHRQEQKNILQRISELNKLLPENALRCTTVGDPYTLLYKSIQDIDTKYCDNLDVLPTDKLTHAAMAMIQEMNANIKVSNDPSNIVVPPVVDNPFFQMLPSNKIVGNSITVESNKVINPPTNTVKIGVPNRSGKIFPVPDMGGSNRMQLVTALLQAQQNRDRIEAYLNIKFSVLNPHIGTCSMCKMSKYIVYVCPKGHYDTMECLASVPTGLCKACGFLCMNKSAQVVCQDGCGEAMVESANAQFYFLKWSHLFSQMFKKVGVGALLSLFDAMESLTLLASIGSRHVLPQCIQRALTLGILDPTSTTVWSFTSAISDVYRIDLENFVGISLTNPLAMTQDITKIVLDKYDVLNPWGQFGVSTPPNARDEQALHLRKVMASMDYQRAREQAERNGLPEPEIPPCLRIEVPVDPAESFVSCDSEESEPGVRVPVILAVRKPPRITESCNHHVLDETATYENTIENPDCFWMLDSITFAPVYAPNTTCKSNCFWSEGYFDHVAFLEKWVDHNEQYIIGRLNNLDGEDPHKFLPLEVISSRHKYTQDREFRNAIRERLDEHNKKDWWDYLNLTNYPWLITGLKILGYTIATLTGLSLVYSTCSWLFKKEPSTPGAEMGHSDYPEERNYKSVRTKGIKIARNPKKPKAQGNNLYSVSEDYVKRNMGHLVVADQQGNELVWCAFVGVCGKYALFMNHYVKAIKSMVALDKTLVFYLREIDQPNNQIQVKFEYLTFVESPLSDIVFLVTPPQFPMFKDIRKLFPPQAYLTSVPLHLGGKLIEAPNRDHATYSVYIRDVEFNQYHETLLVAGPDGEEYEITDLLEYNYSKKGACGSVIAASNYDYPLVGVHVAGMGSDHAGYGYAVIISREDLDIPESQMAVDIEEALFDDDISKSPLQIPENVKLGVLGVVAKGVFLPQTNSSVLSDIASVLPEPLTAPTIMSNTDPRYLFKPSSPLIDGIVKHGGIPGHLDPTTLKRVSEALSGHFEQFRCPRLNPGVLTISESIAGFRTHEEYQPIPLDTSAGWPWVTKGKLKDKTPWIYPVRDEQQQIISATVHQDLLEVLETKEQLRKQGIVPCTVFADMLKDERKLKEKIIKQGSTRVFCASPVDFSIACRQYFMDFYATLQHHRPFTFVSIGISVDGPQWGKLASYLLEVGNNIFSFDYKDFGPTYSAQATICAGEVVKSWCKYNNYTAEQLQCITTMMYELCNSKHLLRTLVYEQYCGSPSGAPITAPQNSLVNVILVTYAWFKITRSTWREFMDNVRLATYGDDGIISVSDQFKEQFNAKTVIDYLKQEGIKVTAADKSDNVIAYHSLSEATYLKRQFVPHPFRAREYLAPLPTHVIEDTAKWIHKQQSTKLGTLENAEQSIRLAYGRGPAYFNQWRYTVNRALQKIGYKTFNLLWEDLDDNFFKKETIQFGY